MTTQVIETKRQPPLWSVKANQRFKAVFHGADARALAEAYAAHHHGEFEIVSKKVPAREQRRLNFLAES